MSTRKTLWGIEGVHYVATYHDMQTAGVIRTYNWPWFWVQVAQAAFTAKWSRSDPMQHEMRLAPEGDHVVFRTVLDAETPPPVPSDGE